MGATRTTATERLFWQMNMHKSVESELVQRATVVVYIYCRPLTPLLYPLHTYRSTHTHVDIREVRAVLQRQSAGPEAWLHVTSGLVVLFVELEPARRRERERAQEKEGRGERGLARGWESLCFLSPPCFINQRNKRNVDVHRRRRRRRC